MPPHKLRSVMVTWFTHNETAATHNVRSWETATKTIRSCIQCTTLLCLASPGAPLFRLGWLAVELGQLLHFCSLGLSYELTHSLLIIIVYIRAYLVTRYLLGVPEGRGPILPPRGSFAGGTSLAHVYFMLVTHNTLPIFWPPVLWVAAAWRHFLRHAAAQFCAKFTHNKTSGFLCYS